jgi:hypothetical protein
MSEKQKTSRKKRINDRNKAINTYQYDHESNTIEVTSQHGNIWCESIFNMDDLKEWLLTQGIVMNYAPVKKEQSDDNENIK